MTPFMATQKGVMRMGIEAGVSFCVSIGKIIKTTLPKCWARVLHFNKALIGLIEFALLGAETRDAVRQLAQR